MSYVNVKLPKELADIIDQITKKRLKGYRNRGEFVSDAVREKIKFFEKEIEEPRFKHVNVYAEEARATLWDNQQKKLHDIYMKDGEMWCEKDESKNCEHIKFVLEIPKVRQGYKNRSWKLPEIE